MGYVEEAASALNRAASEVPLEMVMGAVSQFDNVAQQVAAVGGDIGGQLVNEAMSVKQQLEAVIGSIHQLRERLIGAATNIQRGGG